MRCWFVVKGLGWKQNPTQSIISERNKGFVLGQTIFYWWLTLGGANPRPEKHIYMQARISLKFYTFFFFFDRNDSGFFIATNQIVQMMIYKLGGPPTKLVHCVRTEPL